MSAVIFMKSVKITRSFVYFSGCLVRKCELENVKTLGNFFHLYSNLPISLASPLLGLWFRIPLEAQASVACACCVLF
jgi:hypothetical protein